MQKKMLRLMGIPVVEALEEAEAQCCELVKNGRADAVASEDMDCLTFGAKVQLRRFKTGKEPIQEITLEEVLSGLELTMDQFIDFCILCGSDYTKTVEGLGPSTALKLIKEHKTIEAVIEQIKELNIEFKERTGRDKYIIPPSERFQFEAARKAFKSCVAHDSSKLELKRKELDEEGLIKFLVDEKDFDIDNLKVRINKFKAAKKAKP